MRIAIAFDHAGLPLKPAIVEAVLSAGCEILDLDSSNEAHDDYPDYAEKLGRAILAGKAERGILVCGSGIGACIASNKMTGIYASICHDTYSARQGVEHDDMNVLCLGARVIGAELARELALAFLNARFLGNDQGGERHARRVAKVHAMEKKR
jgi:ribose 5-phosphate isomerase B